MELLPNEQIIKQSSDSEFTLTNFRVVLKYSRWFNTYGNSIFLEDISSVEQIDRGWLILLILGVLMVLFGVYSFFILGGGFISIGSSVLGAVFILMWWHTRRTVIRVTPNGGEDLVIVVSKNNSQAEDILFNIEMAKINRIQQLYNSKF